jgi:hypothetical protein
MTRLGTFTVEGLAARSGVSQATVRTVLRRHPAVIRKVGVERTGKAGGQPHRYQVDPEHEAELLDALAALRADLIPAGDADQIPAELASDPIWLPLSVPAAESVLLDEFPEAPADERPDLLQAADDYIEHARSVLDAADAAAPTNAQLTAHLRVLDFARSVAEAEMSMADHANCKVLLEQVSSLPWDVVGADAKSRVLTWVMRLVDDSAARDAARMLVDVLYPSRRTLPGTLNAALQKLKVMMPNSSIHVGGIPAAATSAAGAISAATYRPRLRVLAFDQASIRAGDSARIIPAVAKKMGPMDELVVAAEEMDSTLYEQAASHGATFMYLDSIELSCNVMHQGMQRASNRYMASAWRSAFDAALGSPVDTANAGRSAGLLARRELRPSQTDTGRSRSQPAGSLNMRDTSSSPSRGGRPVA